MAGWTTCDFTSSLAVCQLYQDDKRLIMKCCVQCLKKISSRSGLELGTASSGG